MISPFALTHKTTGRERAMPLARALVQRGHRVRLLVPAWDDPAQAGRRWLDGGVRVECVPLPAPLLLRLPLLLARRAAHKTDVVHVFKPKAYAGLAASLLHLRHARWLLDHDDWEGRGGWNDANPYSTAQRRLFQWQEQTLPRQASAVTVASRTLEAQVWGLGQQHTYYQPNGAERARYVPWLTAANPAAVAARRAELGLTNAPTVLLYTRFIEFGLDWLLAYLKRLAEQVVGVRLLVVGSGFFGEEATLLRAAAAAGLSAQVVHQPVAAGWLADGTLARTLACADMAIFPMRDNLINRSKCSVRMIDALAMGLPLVADRVGQQAEYVAHNETGLLVEPSDLAGFVAASSRLLHNPQLRTEFGLAAQVRLWRLFDWAQLATIAEAAYRFVVDPSG